MKPYKVLIINGITINVYEWWGNSRYVDIEIVDAPNNKKLRMLILKQLRIELKSINKVKHSHRWMFNKFSYWTIENENYANRMFNHE